MSANAPDLPRPIIPEPMMFSWDSQVRQYPATGRNGISYLRGWYDKSHYDYADCLLYYQGNRLLGVLNHYPRDSGWEKAGNANIWVHPAHQRRGIALKLLAEADRRWHLNFEQQRYSPAGRALVERYLEKRR